MGLFIKGGYRSAEEVNQFKNERDPVTLFRTALLDSGMSESALVEIEGEALKQIEEAVAFAKESAFPDPEEAFELIHANPIPIRR